MKQTRSCRFFRNGPLFLVVALLLLPFYYCKDAQSGYVKALHSCELFSISEIEAIIGSKVDTPPRENHKVDKKSKFWMSMCNYYAPDSDVSLGIMIQPLSPSSSPEEAYNSYVTSLKSNFPDYQVTTMENIGKKAIWSADTGQLTIFNDHHMVLITSMKVGASGEEKLTLAQKFGSLALQKLR